MSELNVEPRIKSWATWRMAGSLVVGVVLVGGLLMSFWDGLTKNWADLAPDANDPGLRPIALPLPPGEAVAWAARVIPTLTRWDVVASDPESGTLHATHTTRVWRFVDDVRLRFEPTAEGCRVVGRSRSRVGKGDFGQNARNLKELRRALVDRAGQLR